jgi:hypothetical protein
MSWKVQEVYFVYLAEPHKVEKCMRPMTIEEEEEPIAARGR